MMFAMEASQLIKLSHIHLLGMPLILFPSAWLFSRTPKGETIKSLVIAVAFCGVLLDVGSWWGVRYLGGVALPTLFLGGAMMGASYVVMTLTSLVFIWRR